jgi:hypothetical protein
MGRGHVAQPNADKAMFILSTIADTFAQRLTREHVRHDPMAAERIRKAMVDLLPPEGSSCDVDRLRHRLLVAPNATSLWFLRVNVHQQLTRSLGEKMAMQQVQALRPLFERSVSPSLLGPHVERRKTSSIGNARV